MATGGLGNLEKLVERYQHAATAAENLIQRLDAATAHVDAATADLDKRQATVVAQLKAAIKPVWDALQAAQGQRTAVEHHDHRRIQQLLTGIEQLDKDTLEILQYKAEIRRCATEYEDIIGSACDRFVERIDETKPPNYILAAFVWAGLGGVVGSMFGDATGRLVDAILAIF